MSTNAFSLQPGSGRDALLKWKCARPGQANRLDVKSGFLATVTAQNVKLKTCFCCLSPTAHGIVVCLSKSPSVSFLKPISEPVSADRQKFTQIHFTSNLKGNMLS